MNGKKFSDAMSELDSRYVDEALNYKKKTMERSWIQWGAVAACFAAVAILGVGVLQSGLLGSKTDVAALENGDEIVFVKSTVGGSLSNVDIAVNVTTRQLTEEEIAAIFPDLPVTANAVFSVDETSAGSGKKLIGFEGKIGNAKMVISTSEVQLLDTEIVGNEESTEVNGTSVTAGYLVTEQNAIYYATFRLGDSTVYVENAGAKAESERVKNELSIIIQKMIDNGMRNLNSLNG